MLCFEEVSLALDFLINVDIRVSFKDFVGVLLHFLISIVSYRGIAYLSDFTLLHIMFVEHLYCVQKEVN